MNYRPKPCAHCGEAFTPKGSTEVLCSMPCRLTHAYRCPRCKLQKPGSEFRFFETEKRSIPRTVRSSVCRMCQAANEWREKNPQKYRQSRRKSGLKQNFGITLDEYEEMRLA